MVSLIRELERGPVSRAPFLARYWYLSDPGVDWVAQEVNHEETSNQG